MFSVKNRSKMISNAGYFVLLISCTMLFEKTMGNPPDDDQGRVDYFTGLINQYHRSDDYFQRGKSYYNLGKYSLALMDLNVVVSRNGNDTAALLCKADTLFALNRMEEAKAQYQKVLAIGSDDRAITDRASAALQFWTC